MKRSACGLIALTLQALWLYVFSRDIGVWRVSPAPAASTIWLQLPPPLRSAPAIRAARASTPQLTLKTPAIVVPSIPQIPLFTAPATPVSPSIDWNSQATVAAGALLSREQQRAAQQAAIGALPFSNFEASKRIRSATQPAFAWGHQPISSWFDIDPDSGALLFKIGRRCVVYLWLTAGWGCAVGRLDPDPGRKDLFDPRYLVPQVETPTPLLPANPASASPESPADPRPRE